MPGLESEIREFSFGAYGVKLRVPVAHSIKYRLAERATGDIDVFPFWARIWPSAIGLCQYMAANQHLLADREVLELAGGLGLPGLLAAQFACSVISSDYVPEAVEMMQESAQLNNYSNVRCRLLDWNCLPADLNPEVLLLSDINYEPTAFEMLYSVLTGFLSRGTTILLSTPQRLMAKPFIERLLPYCVDQEEQVIDLDGEQTYISLLVLRSSTNR